MTSTRNISSAQELYDLLNESGLIQKLNQQYFEGESAGSGKVQQELLAWLNENKIMVDGKKITLNNLKIHEGGNNFNIMIQQGKVGMVMQFGLRPPAVDEAIQFVSSSGERPKWLAEQYGMKTFTGASDFIKLSSSSERHENNRFDTENVGVLTVQEFCPSNLSAKVNELHSSQNPNKNAEIIKLATLVGLNMGAMLSDISGSNVLWTDMKPGNVLFHSDGSLAIADTKALTPIEKIPYKRVKGKSVLDYAGLVTDGFLSDHIRRNEISAEMKREQLPALWEKEYSYQLGVLLYYVATGKEAIGPMFVNDPYQALDFNTGIFAKQDGKFVHEDAERLQFSIEKLMDHQVVEKDNKASLQTNPDNRIHYSQAVQLLEVISDKDLFNAKVKEIEQQNKEHKANGELRNSGRQAEIKLPKELIAMQKSIADIKPNYEKRLMGLKHKFANKNSVSAQEKNAVISAINKKAEELIAQYPKKSVAQIQAEMQTYLRREAVVLENKKHVKSALHKYIRSAAVEINKQQSVPLVNKVKPKAEVKENIPLKLDEYIKLYFANTSKTVRNRPFDTSHYKDRDTKKPGEYGLNALAWKISDIQINEINPGSVTALRNAMQNVIKDLEPHLPNPPSESDKKAIQSLLAGYVFNAFNQKMLAQLKNNLTDDQKSVLKQQAELVRFVVDDLVAGKSTQETMSRLETRNIEKLKAIAHRSIYNELVRHEDMAKTIRQEELNALKLAGIKTDDFVSRLRSFAVIGENELDKQIDPKKAKTEFHRKQVQTVREVLSDAWARTALHIDKEISNKSKYPMMGILVGEQEHAIKNHDLTKDYQDLLVVSEGVLSITKFFATVPGMKLMNGAEKEQLIQSINTKLATAIANYPFHPKTGERVTANDIRREMRDELLKYATEPAFKGLIEKQIERVTHRQTALLNKPKEVIKPKEITNDIMQPTGKKFGY